MRLYSERFDVRVNNKTKTTTREAWFFKIVPVLCDSDFNEVMEASMSKMFVGCVMSVAVLSAVLLKQTLVDENPHLAKYTLGAASRFSSTKFCPSFVKVLS